MLLAARDYIKDNKAGQTEIWMLSDLRENDWNAASGRWQVLRDGFLELPQGVRFHLLAYPDSSPENLAVRVTDVRRRKTSDAGELLVTLKVTRPEGTSKESITVPVGFEIDGARVRGHGLTHRRRDRAQRPPDSAGEGPGPRLGAGLDSGRRQSG